MPVACKTVVGEVVGVAAGLSHSLIVLKSGKVMASGCNKSSQLGIPHSRNTSTFVELKDM